MRALADLPRLQAASVTTVTRTARSRAREAGRAWLDFWHEHTYEHANGRCPVLRLYASYKAWAKASDRDVATLDDIILWTADLDYRLAGRSRDGRVADSTYWLGLVGREYDPAGWPSTWTWPDTHDRNPAPWWIARSRLRAAWSAENARRRTEP